MFGLSVVMADKVIGSTVLAPPVGEMKSWIVFHPFQKAEFIEPKLLEISNSKSPVRMDVGEQETKDECNSLLLSPASLLKL